MKFSLLRPSVLALVLCLLSLTACGGEVASAPTPAPSSAPTPVITPTPKPVLTWSEQVFEEEYTAPDGTVVMTTRYTLPDILQANENPAWQAIHDFYAREGGDLTANAAQQEEWALGDYESAESTGFPFSPYVDEQSYAFTRLTDQWASVLRTHYMNSGGPYPTGSGDRGGGSGRERGNHWKKCMRKTAKNEEYAVFFY